VSTIPRVEADQAPLLARPYYQAGDPGSIVASLAHVPELLEVCAPLGAIRRLRDLGICVRIATTTEGLTDDRRERLCALHRGLGIGDEWYAQWSAGAGPPTETWACPSDPTTCLPSSP
jgi:hypothetical protein